MCILCVLIHISVCVAEIGVLEVAKKFGSREWLKKISSLMPFSSGNFNQWLQRFKTCAAANAWKDNVKELKLPILLEGGANSQSKSFNPSL